MLASFLLLITGVGKIRTLCLNTARLLSVCVSGAEITKLVLLQFCLVGTVFILLPGHEFLTPAQCHLHNLSCLSPQL